jgi:hypothetical protein
MIYKALALTAAILAASTSSGTAAGRPAKAPVVKTVGVVEQTGGRYYRRRAVHGPRFAGRRIGFYSYSYRDVINTYGMSRSLYGSINTYRDPYVDRQTPAGPFDHGFFFDSGHLPRGGDSPYIR